ncbi:hypothetical protein [Paludisphaera borealis]|nr:hypothetical protein [Paludisphaera borealis]
MASLLFFNLLHDDGNDEFWEEIVGKGRLEIEGEAGDRLAVLDLL